MDKLINENNFYSPYGGKDALHRASSFVFFNPLAARLSFDGGALSCNTPSVIIVGFKHLGKGVLFSSVSSEQFFRIESGEYSAAPVNYLIFDDSADGKEYIEDGLDRRLSVEGEDGYLPFAPAPAFVKRFAVEGNLNALPSLLKESEVAKSSLIITALDDAAQSALLAASLAAAGLDVIDAAAKHPDAGLEKTAVCRHSLYGNSPSSAKEFYLMNAVKRESNVFACLSLRSKLLSLGFDLTRSNGKDDSAYGEFEKKYSVLRDTLAVQEHQRWNAYMFACGFMPASIKEFTSMSKSELEEEGKHSNLTTFYGLKMYADMLADQNGTLSSDYDVIKYDYQLLDDVKQLLDATGYTIIKARL